MDTSAAADYSARLTGAIAQLGERNTGSVEVGGSIPPGSTKFFAFYLLAVLQVQLRSVMYFYIHSFAHLPRAWREKKILEFTFFRIFPISLLHRRLGLDIYLHINSLPHP